MKKLYFGGDIITMVSGQEPYAVMIEGDKITGILSREEAESAEADEKINLEGKTLAPSFIDPHSHFMNYAVELLQINLSGCRSYDEILSRISDYIKEKNPPKGQWIRAKGYDHNDLPQGKNITRWELDKVTPDNPVIVKHKSGHMGVFNTKALEMLQVDEKTPVPDGGAVGLTDGVLNGYMEESAFVECTKRLPMNSYEELKDAFLEAQNVYFSRGITTAQDGYINGRRTDIYENFLRSGNLKMDIKAFADSRSMDALEKVFGKDGKGISDKFSIPGYKIFLDGSPQGRTAWMREPYLGGDGNYRAYGTMPFEAVYGAVKQAALEGRQILAHCNGDMAAQQYLDAIEKVEKEGIDVAKVRPVMIHAQLLGADQVPRLKELGVMASFFVAHTHHWGDIHIKNFGMERASGISPAGQALRLGIPFTFHQDSPVIEPDMMETLWCAVTRMTKSGVCLGPELAITPYEALKAVTVNAAYQYFEEDIKGTLEAGKKADMMILDKNPLKVPYNDIPKIKVCETVKDGETVFKR